MNILLIGGSYLLAALRKKGNTVIHCNHYPNSDLQLTHPVVWNRLASLLEARGFIPDACLYADDGNLPLLLDPQHLPCPTIFYSIDTYCNPWHVPYARTFDHIFVAQKDFLQLFTDENPEWLPLFCLENNIPQDFPERDLAVSFVGTLEHKNNPGRKPFLQKFNEYTPLVMRSGNYIPIFQRSRIVLNQTAFGEINFRCFEAMALGAALLMEKCANGMDELFHPGIDILPVFTRNDAAEAARIARIFLNHPAALERIAASGRELVLARHTDFVRAGAITDTATKLALEQAHLPRLNAMEKYEAYARTAFGMLAAELNAEQMKDYRDFFFAAATGKRYRPANGPYII